MSAEPVSKILFVDDEQYLLDAVERYFHNKYALYTATNGFEALEKMADEGPFAVIVTDLRMSEMDGMTFIRKARQISPDTVFVVLTGYADLDVAVDAVNERKIYRFLTKPCPPEDLEEVLKECLYHYENLMNMASFSYTAVVDKSGKIFLNRSQGCYGVTGYCAQEFINNPDLWREIVHPKFRNELEKQARAISKGDEVPAIEFKITKKDGTLRWLRDTVVVRKKEDDTFSRWDGFIEDITEKKQMEQALLESEARYQKMVANVPGLVYQFVLRSDGKIRFKFLSESVNDIFGLEPEEVINDHKMLVNKIYAADRAEFYSKMAESAAELTPWQWSGRFNCRGEEKWFQCLARPERLDSGETIWDGLMMDITDLRKVEQHAQALAKFPGENPNPVLRILDNGHIVYANKASETLLALWAREVGQKLPDHLFEMAMHARKKGKPDCVEINTNGKYFSTVFAPIKNQDYINIYARDITDMKNVEVELRKANQVLKEHDRLKSEFVSTVSHELRTPLCIFKNILSNAIAGVMGKVSGKLRENLIVADKNIDRLSRIVSDFLDISKIEAGAMKMEKRPVKMQELIKDTVESLRSLISAKSIEITTNFDKKTAIVSADRDRIIQVLTNLIGNAIKFVPSKGKINVELEQSEDEVRVCVSDNGPGMTREEIEKIFDRFVQIHLIKGAGEHGTGLGLTISKELIEMHEGKLWVESVRGQGSNFYFTLPKTGAEITENTAGDQTQQTPENDSNSNVNKYCGLISRNNSDDKQQKGGDERNNKAGSDARHNSKKQQK
jgi:PAS domain S-box-containing protein